MAKPDATKNARKHAARVVGDAERAIKSSIKGSLDELSNLEARLASAVTLERKRRRQVASATGDDHAKRQRQLELARADIESITRELRELVTGVPKAALSAATGATDVAGAVIGRSAGAATQATRRAASGAKRGAAGVAKQATAATNAATGTAAKATQRATSGVKRTAASAAKRVGQSTPGGSSAGSTRLPRRSPPASKPQSSDAPSASPDAGSGES